MAGCLESYRADLRRGKNPFEGAFPLWRNEQFRAATLSEDPVKLETYAKIERAIMTAAEREETRRRNAADAAAGDEATFTGVGGAALPRDWAKTTARRWTSKEPSPSKRD